MEHFKPSSSSDHGVAALEERKRRIVAALYEAFRRSNDVVFYTDIKGIILDINEAFTHLYGYTPAEAIGQTPRILRSKHSSTQMYQNMWKSILDPKKGYWRGELINRTKDGREVPVLLTITAVRDNFGAIAGYVSNALDMSEQIRLQSRLANAEALANLGEMAAVVAHEIRNPLGSIVMASKQLGSDTLSPEDRGTVVQVLKEESRRLNEVLSNFLAYARPRELKLSRGDLNALVRDICSMLESNKDLAGNIRMEVHLEPGLEPFPMDADQIRQVLWNIVLNAIQAMDGAGKLTISTKHIGDQTVIRIQDTGSGISETALKEVFKPFYTTKQRGTGLGLSIADRIIKAHGGNIQIESRPGAGSTFSISLPVIQG